MDVIPCTMEFSDMEKEKGNCFSRGIFHGLIKTQIGIQDYFRHFPSSNSPTWSCPHDDVGMMDEG